LEAAEVGTGAGDLYLLVVAEAEVAAAAANEASGDDLTAGFDEFV
jgi:hypothetical protein